MSEVSELKKELKDIRRELEGLKELKSPYEGREVYIRPKDPHDLGQFLKDLDNIGDYSIHLFGIVETSEGCAKIMKRDSQVEIEYIKWSEIMADEDGLRKYTNSMFESCGIEPF